MKVLALPADERPREKLVRFGVDVLSDAELLALLLGSGTKGKNVMEMAREVLECFGGLQGLCESNLHRAKSIDGIGQSRLSILMAVGEISKRIRRGDSTVCPTLYEAVEAYRKRHYQNEEAYLLYLDGRIRVSGSALLSKGLSDKTPLTSNDVLRLALCEGATRFALLHVHPSGIPLPSKADLQLTQEVVTRAKELRLSFYDHLIVSSGGVYSFKEQGHL